MELTKEHFDQVVKGLATKQDIRDGVDELARIIAETIAAPFTERFDDLEKRLDVTEQIKLFERKFQKLEEALHIKL
jgi:hypothetical protein